MSCTADEEARATRRTDRSNAGRADMPALHLLRISLPRRGAATAPWISREWERQCERTPPCQPLPSPRFKPWDELRSEDKYACMHGLAERLPTATYLSPYRESTIGDMKERGAWSVEHVWPRSKVDKSTPLGVQCISDPLGWMTADRSANSQRSNLPLLLWRMPGEGVSTSSSALDGRNLAALSVLLFASRVNVDREQSYAPLLRERARIARKWLYIRATYADVIHSVSREQWDNRHNILALVKRYPVTDTEVEMNDVHRRVFMRSNPLVESQASADRWLDDPAWRARVFGTKR